MKNQILLLCLVFSTLLPILSISYPIFLPSLRWISDFVSDYGIIINEDHRYFLKRIIVSMDFPNIDSQIIIKILVYWLTKWAPSFTFRLYWITKRAGEKRGSALMNANAWHHRADAISSFVALIGVGKDLLMVFNFWWSFATHFKKPTCMLSHKSVPLTSS